MTYGQMIRTNRRAKRMKLEELARRANVPIATLSRCEREVTGPFEHEPTDRIAQALGMNAVEAELLHQARQAHERRAVVLRGPRPDGGVFTPQKNAPRLRDAAKLNDDAIIERHLQVPEHTVRVDFTGTPAEVLDLLGRIGGVHITVRRAS